MENPDYSSRDSIGRMEMVMESSFRSCRIRARVPSCRRSRDVHLEDHHVDGAVLGADHLGVQVGHVHLEPASSRATE